MFFIFGGIFDLIKVGLGVVGILGMNWIWFLGNVEFWFLGYFFVGVGIFGFC